MNPNPFTNRRRRSARAVGDLLPQALRELGMPSKRLTQRVRAAWDLAAAPGWKSETAPLALTGGVLLVGVRSASLRQELAQFHAARLLDVLRAALPDTTLVGVRFTSEFEVTDADDGAQGRSSGDSR